MSTSSTESTSGTPAGGGQNAPVPASQPSVGGEPTLTAKEAVKKAYSEATTALRLAHRDEFNADVKTRAKALGHDWTPRPTAEEKRRAEFKRMLDEDPTLAEVVTGPDA